MNINQKYKIENGYPICTGEIFWAYKTKFMRIKSYPVTTGIFPTGNNWDSERSEHKRWKQIYSHKKNNGRFQEQLWGKHIILWIL